MRECEEPEAGNRKQFLMGGQSSNSNLHPMPLVWALSILQSWLTSVVKGRLHVAGFIFALLCHLFLLTLLQFM